MRDPSRMLEILRRFLLTLAKLFRVRRDLLIENLLLVEGENGWRTWSWWLRVRLPVNCQSKPRPR